MTDLEAHPVANLFPMMSDEELVGLAEDIRTHGLREPIWLHPDGRIIDGRNRYRACIGGAVKPQFRTWDGEGSLVDLVLSLNLHRRHLSQSQKAVIALRVEKEYAIEAKERQRAAGGDKFHASDQEERLWQSCHKRSPSPESVQIKR